MSLRFDAQASGCRWRGLPSLALYAQGKATADVVNVAPGVFFIQRLLTETLQETVSVFADTRSGQALMVASRIGERERPGATGFRQRFTAAKIDGIPRRGAPPALTTDSIGRRALYRHSADTVHEHVSLIRTGRFLVTGVLFKRKPSCPAGPRHRHRAHRREVAGFRCRP